MNRDALFHDAIDLGVQRALLTIRHRYHKPKTSQANLPYHQVPHTRSVIRRTVKILKAIRSVDKNLVSHCEIGLGKLAAACHDIEHTWQMVYLPKGNCVVVIRGCAQGLNERASVRVLGECAHSINKEMGRTIFSEYLVGQTEEAVYATIVDRDDRGAIFQPNVHRHTGVVARAVALADLGTAGMDGSKAFLRDGNNLFREHVLSMVGIKEQMRQGLPKKTQVFYRGLVINWSKAQVFFARCRQERLHTELVGLPDAVADSIKKLFTKFEESIMAASQQYKLRKKMSFEELVADLGY